MFNLAIKLSLLSFIGTMALPLVKSLDEQICAIDSTDIGGCFRITLQAILTAIMIFLLSKKTPELVSSLLSGQPQLGGSMTQMAGSVASKAQTVAAVATGGVGAVAGAATKAALMGQGGVKGTLMELGKAGVAGATGYARNHTAFGRMAAATYNASLSAENSNLGRAVLGQYLSPDQRKAKGTSSPFGSGFAQNMHNGQYKDALSNLKSNELVKNMQGIYNKDRHVEARRRDGNPPSEENK